MLSGRIGKASAYGSREELKQPPIVQPACWPSMRNQGSQRLGPNSGAPKPKKGRSCACGDQGHPSLFAPPPFNNFAPSVPSEMLAAAATNAKALATQNAKAALEEINLARKDPKKYTEHLKPMLQYFDGMKFLRPGQKITLITQEGAAAVEEAIKELEGMKPLPPLTAVSPGLCAAAYDHVMDLSKTGNTGHDGSDGSSPFDRMNRHGEWQGSAAENIAFGDGDVRARVVQLIIDDGVPLRGHRKNIFTEAFRFLGIAEGPHPKFSSMQVQTFAAGFKEKPGTTPITPAVDISTPRTAASSTEAPTGTPAAAPKPAATAAALAAAPATADASSKPANQPMAVSGKEAAKAAAEANAAAAAGTPLKKPAAPVAASPSTAPRPPPGGRTDVKTTIQKETGPDGKTKTTTTKTTIITEADGSTQTTVETMIEISG